MRNFVINITTLQLNCTQLGQVDNKFCHFHYAIELH
jgi:hypothetical protein